MNKAKFLKWVKINHGDCENKCDIRKDLTKYYNKEISFDKLFETVKDIDDEWEASFNNFTEWKE